jgi:hypothetical protein
MFEKIEIFEIFSEKLIFIFKKNNYAEPAPEQLRSWSRSRSWNLKKPEPGAWSRSWKLKKSEPGAGARIWARAALQTTQSQQNVSITLYLCLKKLTH